MYFEEPGSLEVAPQVRVYGVPNDAECLGAWSRPATVVPRDTPLSSVPRQLLDAPESVVVVADEAGKAVGLIRPRDIFVALDAHGRGSLGAMTAGDIAGPALIFADDETAVATAALMAREGQDVAVIIDAAGAVRGIWTAADALRWQAHGRLRLRAEPAPRARLVTEAAPSIGVEASLAHLVGRLHEARMGFIVVVDRAMRPVGAVTAAHLVGEVAGHRRDSLEPLVVGDVMTRGTAHVDADAPLEAAAEIFATHAPAFVCVCDGDALLGVIRPERLLEAIRSGAAD